MRYLGTGGAGFIGSTLSRLLIAEGHTVRVFDDLRSGSEVNIHRVEVDLLEGNILNTTLLESAARDCQCITFTVPARGLTTTMQQLCPSGSA